jgi:hypothetical protein
VPAATAATQCQQVFTLPAGYFFGRTNKNRLWRNIRTHKPMLQNARACPCWFDARC